MSTDPRTDPLNLDEIKPWLALCGSCDAGLPMSCTCPPGDIRAVLARVMDALTDARSDLDARDARVRAEAAAAIRAEATQLEQRDGVGHSYAYGFADAADLIDPAAPSSSPGDAAVRAVSEVFRAYGARLGEAVSAALADPPRPTGTPGPSNDGESA